jgi:hypothetical protein
MPNSAPFSISSYEQRKVAILRAAELLADPTAFDEDLEFDELTQAVVEFDLAQEDQEFVEIPQAFSQFLSRTDRQPPAP